MKYYLKSITLVENEYIFKISFNMKSNTNIILFNEKEIYQNLLKLNSQFKKIMR